MMAHETRRVDPGSVPGAERPVYHRVPTGAGVRLTPPEPPAFSADTGDAAIVARRPVRRPAVIAGGRDRMSQSAEVGICL
jgi:hypothetical protein